MRLRPVKIEVLAGKLLEELKSNRSVKVVGEESVLLHEIKEVIAGDLAREEKLEEDAKNLLKPHMDQIQRKNMNYQELLQKTKKQLARKKGIIL
ncbi:MAG: DUF507 family protein [bacterium]